MDAFISDDFARALRQVACAAALGLASCGRSDLLDANDLATAAADDAGLNLPAIDTVADVAPPPPGSPDVSSPDVSTEASAPSEGESSADALPQDAPPEHVALDLDGASFTNDLCATRGCPSNWWMFGYDASHSGYNPAETGTPPMTGEWATTIAAQASLHPACAEDGSAFVTYEGVATRQVVGVGIADGAVLWTHDLGMPDSVGHPIVVKGTIYVQATKSFSDPNGDSTLWALDAKSGDVRWSAPFASQWDNYWSPTVAGPVVYIDGGRFGGLYAFQVSDGSQLFFDMALPQYDSWTPAFYQGVLYTYVGGEFVAHDPLTGNVLWNNSIRGNFGTGYSINAAPAFEQESAFVIAPPQLAAIDLATQDLLWITSASFVGTPAVAGGVVYAISGGNLVASDASTGTALYTFAGDGQLSFPPVVANGFAYVSSASHVYAVDVATHAMAWSAAVGGWLSVASGRLLVAGSDGVLHGFALSSADATAGEH